MPLICITMVSKPSVSHSSFIPSQQVSTKRCWWDSQNDTFSWTKGGILTRGQSDLLALKLRLNVLHPQRNHWVAATRPASQPGRRSIDLSSKWITRGYEKLAQHQVFHLLEKVGALKTANLAPLRFLASRFTSWSRSPLNLHRPNPQTLRHRLWSLRLSIEMVWILKSLSSWGNYKC